MIASDTKITALDIESSLSELLDSGCEHFAGRFYWLLFDRFPELERFFENVNMQHQAAMLTMGLQVIVQHDRQPRRSSRDYLRVLGERHGNRGISREHYAAFEDVLLTALAEFHGDRWHSVLANHWQSALHRALDVMVSE